MSIPSLILKVNKNNTSIDLLVRPESTLALLVQVPGIGPQGPAGPAGAGIGPTNFTLPGVDGSISIPSGTMIWGVGVDNASDLAAMSFGTTDGGQQLLPETPVTATGEFTFFPLWAIYKSNGDLYINGITSNTSFKVYMS